MFKRAKSKDRDDKDVAEFLLNDIEKHKDEELIEHPFRPNTPISESSKAYDNENKKVESRNLLDHETFYDEYLSKAKVDGPYKNLLSNGLGKVLLNTQAYLEEIASKNNLKMPKNHFNQTCTNIENFLQEFNDKIDSTLTNVNDTLNEKLKQQSNFNRNSQLHNANLENFLPIFPEKSLELEKLSDLKLSLVNSTFPTRQKFSGHGTPSVTEFLRNLKTAQNQCMLNENQFKNVMLRCVTGLVYEQLACLIDGDITVPEIINSLLLRYDTRLKPDEANNLLNSYVVPKNADFNLVISEIMSLAQRASLAQPPQCRKAIYDYTAVDTLIKNLPVDSQNDGRKLKADLTMDLNRAPTFDELSRALMSYSSAIDHNYAKDRKSKINTNKHNSYHKIASVYTENKPFVRSVDKKIFGYPEHTQINEISTAPANNYTKQRVPYNGNPRSYDKNNNNKNNYNRMSVETGNNKSMPYKKYDKPNIRYNNNYNNRNRSNNTSRPKLYCKLCGKGGHTSTSFCWEMRTNSGAFTLCNPVPSPCETCLEEQGKELYHSDDLCMLRPRAKYLKQNNMWKPPSDETRQEMDRKAVLFYR